MPPKDLIGPKEAAEILQCSVPTVRRWADDGKLTAVRSLGNQRRFRRHEIEALRDAWLGKTPEAASA